jgi:opacity protein-like surface antigen
MFKRSRIALAAGVLAVTAVPTLAADLPPPPPAPLPPPVIGGWYLRGDIGYKFYADPDVTFNDSAVGVDFDDEELDDTGLIGAGIGYQFNPWFRADVTVDYEWPSDFEGTTFCPAPCGGAGGAVTNVETGEFSAITTLANVYVDLGNYYGFSPYVGAGAGVSYLMMDDIVTTSPAGSLDVGDADDWSFAWALMAGLAYHFTPQLALDVGYRYLNLGEVETDTLTDIGAGDGTFSYDDLQAHEVRVGVRYTF